MTIDDQPFVSLLLPSPVGQQDIVLFISTRWVEKVTGVRPSDYFEECWVDDEWLVPNPSGATTFMPGPQSLIQNDRLLAQGLFHSFSPQPGIGYGRA